METEAILANDLRKVYGHPRMSEGIVAVDSISLLLPQRSSLGLVGESGSGKTTTVRMLVGLERPSGGSVKLMGRELPQRRLHARERRMLAKVIQMVFQDPYGSLDPTQSVGESIGELLRLHTDLSKQARQARIFELLEAVGIARARSQARPRELSGGQRQRVAIARALASEPQILVLDEAVSALDVSIQAQILNLLIDLRSRLQLTYVVISHDLAVVRYLVEEVAVMKDGRIVEAGAVEQVLRRPRHPYTQKLIESVPRPGKQALGRQQGLVVA